MREYSYKAKNKSGETLAGKMVGQNKEDVAKRLVSSALYPIEIFESNGGSVSKKKILPRDVVTFTRQLFILLKAGIPIVKAFKSMEVASKNENMRDILSKIRSDLESGLELSLSLQKHSQLFSVFYVSMVRVGEVTGTLEEILSELYTYLQFEEEMKAKAKTALRYPMIVMGVMAIALAIMMVLVIPAFAEIYKNFNAELPWATKALIGVSNFAVSWGWLVVIGGGIGIKWFKDYIKTESGKSWWDVFKFKFPVVGSIMKKSVYARFAKSFSLAIKAGIPIVQAIGLVSKVIDNNYVEYQLLQIGKNIERGNSLYESMLLEGAFDNLVLEMVATGEESGSLESMVKEVSTLYEQDIEYDLKNLSTQLEPLLLVVIGGLLVVFALGMFLPMWDLSSVVIKK